VRRTKKQIAHDNLVEDTLKRINKLPDAQIEQREISCLDGPKKRTLILFSSSDKLEEEIMLNELELEFMDDIVFGTLS
jgi:hypothetical protein